MGAAQQHGAAMAASKKAKGHPSPSRRVPTHIQASPSARVGAWTPTSQTMLLPGQHPRIHDTGFHLAHHPPATHTHTHTDLFTTVTCLCMGISLGGPLPTAGGRADRALSAVGFTTPHAPLPRGGRGTGLLLPSSGTLKDLGCRKVPLGFPKEFAEVAVSSLLLPPTQRDFKQQITPSGREGRGHTFPKDK